MPEYSDIYVVSEKRDKVTLFEFLDSFIPFRGKTCEEYLIPQYVDHPKHVYSKVENVINWCVANTHDEYYLHWKITARGKPEHASEFYLKDGYVIYGFATDAICVEYANDFLLKLKEFLGTESGYIAHES